MPRSHHITALRAALAAEPQDRSADPSNDRLHDAAYRQMRQALMDGRFAPGQTFSLRTLAEVFGTSPMPVRDALKRLVAEHALEMRTNRSVMLPPMTRSRFQEILRARLALEPMLALRGTPLLTIENIHAMERDHHDMCAAARSQDASTFLAANRRFHFRLYEAAESTVILPMVESLWMQAGPHLHRIFSARAQALDTADHHHMNVLRALRRQDGTATSQAIWDDLSDAADSILAMETFDGE